MKRRAVVGIAVIGILTLVAALLLARRSHLSVLTPSELAAKRLTLPAPPDESCAQIQRALAGSSGEKPVRNTNPLSADDVAIYRGLPGGARPTIPAGGQLAVPESIDLIPIYRAVMDGL